MSTEGRMIRRCSSTPSSSEHHRKSSELRLRPFFKPLELNVEDSLVIPDGGHPENSQPDKRFFHFAPVLWPAIFLWLGTLSSAIWRQWLPDQTLPALWIACSFAAMGLLHRDLSGLLLQTIVPFFLGIHIAPLPWQPVDLPSAPVRISGEVISPPRFVRSRSGSPNTAQVRMKLDQLIGATGPLHGHLIIESPADLLHVGRGSRIEVQLNEGEGILRKVSRYGGVHSDANENLLGIFDLLRQDLSRRWQPIAHGWASALVLGERKLLPPEVIDTYRETGLAHLLAISGLHVGLLLGILNSLARRLPGRIRKVWTLIIPLILILQTLLSGADAPAIRATTTAILIGWGFHAGRVLSPIHTLSICMAVWCMTGKAPPDPGATISLSAILGLMLQKQPDNPLDEMGLSRRPIESGWTPPIRSGYAAFCGAHAALVWWSPLICFWGPLLTLLILPWVMGVLLVAVVSLMLLPWIPLEAWSSFWDFLEAGLIHLPEAFDRLPGTPFILPPLSPISWTLIFTVTLLILTSSTRLVPFAIPVVSVALITSLWIPLFLQETRLHVELFSRGRGQALFIAAGRTRLLFDAGDTSTHDGGYSRIHHRLWNMGVRQIDALFLSHPHLDHQGAVPGLIQQGVLKRIVVTGSYDCFATGRSMLKLAHRYQIPVTRLQRGQIWKLGEFRITVISDGIPQHLGPTANDLSPLLLIEGAGKALLTTGDATAPVLASTPILGPLDHALLPHHGAPTEGVASWLGLLQPAHLWVARKAPIPRQTKFQLKQYSNYRILFHGAVLKENTGFPTEKDIQFMNTRLFVLFQKPFRGFRKVKGSP